MILQGLKQEGKVFSPDVCYLLRKHCVFSPVLPAVYVNHSYSHCNWEWWSLALNLRVRVTSDREKREKKSQLSFQSNLTPPFPSLAHTLSLFLSHCLALSLPPLSISPEIHGKD